MAITSGSSRTPKKGKPMQLVLGFIRIHGRRHGTTPKDIKSYLMNDHAMTESRAKKAAGLCLKRGVELGLLARKRNLFSLHSCAMPLVDRGARSNCGHHGRHGKKHKKPKAARGGRRSSRRGHGRSRRGRGRGKSSKGKGRKGKGRRSCRGHRRSRGGRGRGKSSKGRGRKGRGRRSCGGRGRSRRRSRRGRGGSKGRGKGRRSRHGRKSRRGRGCKGRGRRSRSGGRRRPLRGDSPEPEMSAVKRRKPGNLCVSQGDKSKQVDHAVLSSKGTKGALKGMNLFSFE